MVSQIYDLIYEKTGQKLKFVFKFKDIDIIRVLIMSSIKNKKTVFYFNFNSLKKTNF
jgi:hypothetical protein